MFQLVPLFVDCGHSIWDFIASFTVLGLCTIPWWNSDAYLFSQMWSMRFCFSCSVPALVLTFKASGFTEHVASVSPSVHLWEYTAL